MDALIAKIDGTAAYLDYMFAGRTIGKHNVRLEAVFKRIQDYGFRVRLDKYPEKIEAIQKMPAPKDVSQLTSFLSILSLDLLLTHSDPNLPIIVAADASNCGMGATLSHRFADGCEKRRSSRTTERSSRRLSSFCRSRAILHIHTPPFHPQSNGQAERFVDTFKRTLAKLKGEEPTVDALQMFLMAYRSTPCPSAPDQRPPVEAFLGSRLRTELDLMLPSRDLTNDTRDIKMESQSNRRNRARRRSSEINDAIFVKDCRGQKLGLQSLYHPCVRPLHVEYFLGCFM
ncbi:hypothetical protein RB195_009587 [Necator americanus]|uniref:Integrase catalytic domain-containing protein n=1 Tax=Necator americanus TaxID=51031 RepID=A0ABR1CTZ4_NECAM